MRALTLALVVPFTLSLTACDEAATVEGTWSITKATYTFTTIQNDGTNTTEDEKIFEAEDAGTLIFQRTEGSVTGFGDHTLTRTLTKVPNGTGAEPGFDEVTGTAISSGWSPGGFDDTEGVLDDPDKDPAITVFDTDDAFNGEWFIRSSGFGGLTLEHGWGVDFGGGAVQGENLRFEMQKQ